MDNCDKLSLLIQKKLFLDIFYTDSMDTEFQSFDSHLMTPCDLGSQACIVHAETRNQNQYPCKIIEFQELSVL